MHVDDEGFGIVEMLKCLKKRQEKQEKGINNDLTVFLRNVTFGMN